MTNKKKNENVENVENDVEKLKYISEKEIDFRI